MNNWKFISLINCNGYNCINISYFRRGNFFEKNSRVTLPLRFVFNEP